MEPSSTAAGSFAAVKLALAAGVFAAIAAVLGLLILPPRTPREFVLRICTTVVSSFIFGPMLAIALIAWAPSLTESARWFAEHSGVTAPPLAILYILGPSMLLAGLPAWWLLGGYMRWTARLQHEDAVNWLGQLLRTLRGQ